MNQNGIYTQTLFETLRNFRIFCKVLFKYEVILQISSFEFNVYPIEEHCLTQQLVMKTNSKVPIKVDDRNEMTSNYLSGRFYNSTLRVTYTFFFFEINRTTDVSIWSQWTMMRLRIYSQVSPRVALQMKKCLESKRNLCSTTLDGPYFATNAEWSTNLRPLQGLAQTISKESI